MTSQQDEGRPSTDRCLHSSWFCHRRTFGDLYIHTFEPFSFNINLEICLDVICSAFNISDKPKVVFLLSFIIFLFIYFLIFMEENVAV